ncbi:isoflavone reductase family protein [Phlyctema vagabunda]|uniref:Isoflavone reductase family protein n=1 Tax=Phlyctema vagabunda TaxID=108571 RepID=A0ABR4P3Z9_9HELO
MSSKLKVTLVGASGATGVSIVNALLEEPEKFQVTAFARSSSVNKPAWIDLAKRGVRVVVTDLLGPENDLVNALQGTDVVISSIFPIGTHQDQVNLVNAAKMAGVKRFVPGTWGPVVPPTGVLQLRDEKEELINYMKALKLPYTVIDVGLWYQTTLPRVPSGKLDYVITEVMRYLSQEVDAKLAMSDLRDVGKHVVKIITDDRTLNKYVLAYNEIWTQRELLDIVRKSTGEEPVVQIVSQQTTKLLLADAEAEVKADPSNVVNAIKLAVLQYFWSWAIRSDNSRENAKFLGYLDTEELYGIDTRLTSYKSFIDEIVEGKGQIIQTDYINA